MNDTLSELQKVHEALEKAWATCGTGYYITQSEKDEVRAIIDKLQAEAAEPFGYFVVEAPHLPYPGSGFVHEKPSEEKIEDFKSVTPLYLTPQPSAPAVPDSKFKIAVDTVRLIVTLADDFQASVTGLSKIVDGKTLFEHSPSENIECYEAWMKLNDTGARLKECCDKIRPALQAAPQAQDTEGGV